MSKYYESYPCGLTVRDVIDKLKDEKDHNGFRDLVDLTLFNSWETLEHVYPNKLKADVAGVLYAAIHGSTDLDGQR